MAETKTTDHLNELKGNLVEIVRPLMANDILTWSEDDLADFTAKVKSVVEMANSVRESHDEMIRTYEEANNIEAGSNPKVATIRGRKVKASTPQGFLKL